MIDSNRSGKFCYIAIIMATALALYLSSLYSYLLFHSLIEIATIAIGFTLFILTWNVRRFLTGNYLNLIGIGYSFIALIDLLHTLAYKGMNVFPGFGANLPTQLWIAARSLQAVTLCAAPLFLERRVDNRAIVGIYAVAVSLLVAIVFSGNFPDCYIEGKGLTPFKIISEYVITAFLLASLYLLFRKRKYLNERVFLLTVSSIACTAVSEISFTAYLSVYGPANLAGHFLKLASYYLIYRAILVTGLKEPFDLVFRDLKQTEQALRNSQDTLEEKVRERTAALRESEEKYRVLFESANYLNRELCATSSCNQIMMQAENEQALLNEICRVICDEAGYRMAWVGYADNDEAGSVRPVAWAGGEEGHLEQAGITWADTELGSSPTGTAIRTGKTGCIQDFETEQKTADWRDKALQRGYRSSIALPLKYENATFGVLTIYSIETNAFTPDEIRFLEELAGDLAFGITSLHNRIERKRAEEDLKESEARFRRLAENARDVIYRMSLPEGIYEYVSPAATELFGYEPEDFYVSPQLTRKIIHPDWLGYFDEEWSKLSGGDMPPTYEFAIVHKSGEVRWLNQRNILIRDEGGRPVAIEGIVTDITERKKSEEELRRLNSELSRLNEELEERVKQRTAELEVKNVELQKMNKLFIDRELRMVELKDKIRGLEERLS